MWRSNLTMLSILVSDQSRRSFCKALEIWMQEFYFVWGEYKLQLSDDKKIRLNSANFLSVNATKIALAESDDRIPGANKTFTTFSDGRITNILHYHNTANMFGGRELNSLAFLTSADLLKHHHNWALQSWRLRSQKLLLPYRRSSLELFCCTCVSIYICSPINSDFADWCVALAPFAIDAVKKLV